MRVSLWRPLSLFFFSSRRRHTRCGRDWSSDVCSSDLFERMTVRHLGGLMLARIDGKSPVEYIQDEETKEQVRRVAKRILLERPERLEEAVTMVRHAPFLQQGM